MPPIVAPTTLLAGRYQLVHRLAIGGMGQVWRAQDKVLGRPVAVKLLRSELSDDPAFLGRFRTEARRTAALAHPGIASVFDYGEIQEPNPTAYLVMELVEGAPLSAVLMREGRLDPGRVLDVIAQAPWPWGQRTRPVWSIGTSSRATCSSVATAWSRSPTSASPEPSARRHGPRSAWSWAPPRISRPSRSPAGRSRRRATSTRSGWSPSNAWRAGDRSPPRIRLRSRWPTSATPHRRCRPTSRNRRALVEQAMAGGMRLTRGTPVTLTVSAGPAVVAVDPARYLGRPLDRALAALTRLGLRVTVETTPAAGDPGTVVGITPSGALLQGDVVAITVASSPLESGASAAPSGDGAAALPRERRNEPGRRDRHHGHGKHD